jgi:hypothetical protein
VVTAGIASLRFEPCSRARSRNSALETDRRDPGRRLRNPEDLAEAAAAVQHRLGQSIH